MNYISKNISTTPKKTFPLLIIIERWYFFLSKIFPILDDLPQHFPKDEYEKIYIKIFQYKDNF